METNLQSIRILALATEVRIWILPLIPTSMEELSKIDHSSSRLLQDPQEFHQKPLSIISMSEVNEVTLCKFIPRLSMTLFRLISFLKRETWSTFNGLDLISTLIMEIIMGREQMELIVIIFCKLSPATLIIRSHLATQHSSLTPQ